MRPCVFTLLSVPLAALALAGPAAAATATGTSSATGPTKLDTTSDHTALIDYRAYLQSLVDDSSAGAQADAIFVRAVRRKCKGALAEVSTLPTAQVSSVGLSDIGAEIGGDLALEFNSEAAAPFAQLSTELTALAWSDPTPSAAIHNWLTAELGVLDLPASRLCPDAKALAAHPLVVPVGSRSFLAVYQSASAMLKQRLSAFLDVLSAKATTNDNALIAQISKLVIRFGTSSAAVEQTDASSLVTVLGLTTS